jgi:hypothetical protein
MLSRVSIGDVVYSNTLHSDCRHYLAWWATAFQRSPSDTRRRAIYTEPPGERCVPRTLREFIIGRVERSLGVEYREEALDAALLIRLLILNHPIEKRGRGQKKHLLIS